MLFLGKIIKRQTAFAEVRLLIVCPLCQKGSIGKVGNNQYYCWECYVEFSIKEDKVIIYEVCDDGTLLVYDKEHNELLTTIGNLKR